VMLSFAKIMENMLSFAKNMEVCEVLWKI
jgi:hypothetical protein